MQLAKQQLHGSDRKISFFTSTRVLFFFFYFSVFFFFSPPPSSFVIIFFSGRIEPKKKETHNTLDEFLESIEEISHAHLPNQKPSVP